MSGNREQEAHKTRAYIERQLDALRERRGHMLRELDAAEGQPGMAQFVHVLKRELAALERRITALEADLAGIAPPPETEQFYAPRRAPDDGEHNTHTFDQYG